MILCNKIIDKPKCVFYEQTEYILQRMLLLILQLIFCKKWFWWNKSILTAKTFSTLGRSAIFKSELEVKALFYEGLLWLILW